MLGFQVLNDKFMRLSQELHRIQRTYTEAHEQHGEDGVPTAIKEQMEIGKYGGFIHRCRHGYVVLSSVPVV